MKLALGYKIYHQTESCS